MTSSQDRRKKERERWFLERAIKRGLPATGDMENSEAPDFVVTDRGLRYGIELVEYYSTGSNVIRHAVAEFRDEVARRIAARLRDARLGRYVHVSLYWLDQTPFVSSRGEALVRSVADQVLALASRWSPDQDRVTIDYEQLPALLQEHFHFIDVWMLSLPEVDVNVQGGEAAMIFPDVAGVQSTISGKDRKYQSCRQRVSHCTLLVVATGSHMSSMLHEFDVLESRTYVSDFDSVFAYDVFSGHLVKLRTIRGQSSTSEFPIH